MADENTKTVSETQEESKPSVAARKDILIFWLRMLGWLATGVVTPITVFSIKFGLFTKYGYQVTTDELGNVTGMNIALNGWGIVSAFLIGFAAISILNDIIDAYSGEYSFTKQILVGLKNRIIPLAIGIAACYFLKGCIDQIIFCLSTIAICQIAAVALNPMPKWKAQKKKSEDYSDLITGLGKFIKSRHKEGK